MPIGRGLIHGSGLELHRLPDADSEVLYVVGGRLEVEAVRLRMVGEEAWIRLRMPDGREGWIHEDDGFEPYHTAMIESGDAVLMEKPSPTSRVIVRLKRLAALTVIRSVDDGEAEWVAVRMKSGREGFVRGATVVVWDPSERGPGGPPAIAGSRLRWLGGAGLWALALTLAGAASRGLGFVTRAEQRRRNTGPIGRLPGLRGPDTAAISR